MRNSLISYLLIIILGTTMNGGCEEEKFTSVAENRVGNQTLNLPPILPSAVKTTQYPDKLQERGITLEGHLYIADKSNENPMAIDYYLPPDSIPVRDAFEVTSNGKQHNEVNNDFHTRDPFPRPLFHPTVVSKDKLFSLTWDNDIFSNTDYYYSNGVSIELLHPVFTLLPSALLLPKAGTGSVNHYSIILTQSLFTPIDPDTQEIQYGDRPFSSFLNLGFSNYSNNFLRRLRLTSRIDVGILGPASLGSAVQKTIHDIEPVGWQNQITNSFVANYFIQVEKGSRISKNLEILGRVSGNLGTLYDNLAAGASIRLYNSSSYFESLVIMPYPENQKHRFNYFVMFSAEGRAILYDATLQGGLFRQESEIYTLQTDQVNRAVFQAKLNAGISYRWVQLDVEHVFLTQEFKTGKNHMWSRIKATFRLRE